MRVGSFHSGGFITDINSIIKMTCVMLFFWFDLKSLSSNFIFTVASSLSTLHCDLLNTFGLHALIFQSYMIQSTIDTLSGIVERIALLTLHWFFPMVYLMLQDALYNFIYLVLITKLFNTEETYYIHFFPWYAYFKVQW